MKHINPVRATRSRKCPICINCPYHEKADEHNQCEKYLYSKQNLKPAFDFHYYLAFSAYPSNWSISKSEGSPALNPTSESLQQFLPAAHWRSLCPHQPEQIH